MGLADSGDPDMSDLRRLGWIAMLVALPVSPAVAAQCHIVRSPAIPVIMKAMHPTVRARINGAKARFIVDTGSFWNILSPAAEAQYNLPERSSPPGVSLEGINGRTGVYVATARKFTVLGVPFRYARFLVGGSAYPSGAAGLIGGRLLRLADVEFDFADGLMRYDQAKHCGDLPLAYWAVNQPIGMVKLRPTTARRPYLIGHASLDGKVIRVLFDTGAAQSMLTLRAARRAGITPHSPGVERAGMYYGVGRKLLQTWIVPVKVFEIGGEKIEHTRILMSDMRMPSLRVGMLLGADFFLSHRVYVANSQNRVYFTYNGGPVFDSGQRYSTKRAATALIGAVASPVRTSAGGAANGPSATGRPGTSAGALMREGMAYASQRRFRLALIDLNRACRLDPRNPRYLLRRGEVYGQDKQPARALADFDAALALRPSLFEAHLARAKLLLHWKHAPADSLAQAKTDINIVSLLAPDESEVLLPLARLYARIGAYSAALREVNLWIYYHGHDALLPFALSTRCGIRAQADRDLAKALKDCDRALGRMPDSPVAHENQGLLYLRLGRFRRSIVDYDAVLQGDPKSAASLYGRGLAELREGHAAQGRSDLAAAQRLAPAVAERFAAMHLLP